MDHTKSVLHFLPLLPYSSVFLSHEFDVAVDPSFPSSPDLNHKPQGNLQVRAPPDERVILQKGLRSPKRAQLCSPGRQRELLSPTSGTPEEIKCLVCCFPQSPNSKGGIIPQFNQRCTRSPLSFQLLSEDKSTRSWRQHPGSPHGPEATETPLSVSFEHSFPSHEIQLGCCLRKLHQNDC